MSAYMTFARAVNKFYEQLRRLRILRVEVTSRIRAQLLFD